MMAVSRRRGLLGSAEIGSLSVELVVLAPVVVMFLLLALAFGRYELAREQVLGATQAAAQAVAVLPSASQMQSAAWSAAAPSVAGQHRSCAQLQVMVDPSRFGPGGFVRVTVSCRVDFSDLLLPGIPGSTTVQAAELVPIDRYRSTQ